MRQHNVCNRSQAGRLTNERMLEERKPFFDASLSYVTSGERGCVKFLGFNESRRTIRWEEHALTPSAEWLTDSGCGLFHGVSFEVGLDWNRLPQFPGYKTIFSEDRQGKEQHWGHRSSTHACTPSQSAAQRRQINTALVSDLLLSNTLLLLLLLLLFEWVK